MTGEHAGQLAWSMKQSRNSKRLCVSQKVRTDFQCCPLTSVSMTWHVGVGGEEGGRQRGGVGKIERERIK